MKNKLYLILLIFLIVFFFLSSKAIVDIKLQELRFYLTKEQLLNYELSSKVLKEKIKQMILSKDDYTNEIKNNILESNIMNSQIGVSNVKLDFMDSYGLFIVNVVRFLSLKKPLTLLEDQNDMIQIQFAFYMERSRKFSIAVKKYEAIAERFGRIDTNENGFVMLHHGFCLAMMGNTEAAIAKLLEAEDVFRGTHFADNSRILINVLLEGQKKMEEIEKSSIAVDKKADIYYENGKYKETLDALNLIENRNNNQNFMRARSLEELGQSSVAINEYIKLVEQKEDGEVAKRANRRLLLIGNIYEKNKDLSDYSKKNAQILGDTEVVKQVEAGSSLIAQAQIIETLTKVKETKNEQEVDPTFNQEEFDDLKKEFEKIVFIETKERTETITNVLPPKVEPIPIKEVVPKIEPKREPENALLMFKLIDGRVLIGNEATFENDMIELRSGDFSISIPDTVLADIEFDKVPKYTSTKISLEKNDGKIEKGDRVYKFDDVWKVQQDGEEVDLRRDKVKKLSIYTDKK
jgi:tetratricopeptide (TPR) repeat protein